MRGGALVIFSSWKVTVENSCQWRRGPRFEFRDGGLSHKVRGLLQGENCLLKWVWMFVARLCLFAKDVV